MQRSATAGGLGGRGGAAKANSPTAAERVSAGIRDLPEGRYLLAVSGGRDSMALLDACSALRTDVIGVATFDHGTGPAATAAADHVVHSTMQRELPVMLGHSERGGRATSEERSGEARGAMSEQKWRRERWAFLRGWAEELQATIVTAHTADDQVETVCMRILRDAGARGLAAMYAASPVARPLIGVSRADVAAYAAVRGVEWVEDPSNLRVTHLRNRVRLELLPAIERARPGFSRDILAIARRAAEWRGVLSAFVDGLGASTVDGDQSTVVVSAAAMETVHPEELPLVWQELVGRAGGSLDWRGTERLAAQSPKVKPGAEIPLSGGLVVSRTATTFVVRNRGGSPPLY